MSEELFGRADFQLKQYLERSKGLSDDVRLNSLENATRNVRKDVLKLINGELLEYQELLQGICNADLDCIRSFRKDFSLEVLRSKEDYFKLKESFENIDRVSKRLEYVQRKKKLVMKNIKANMYLTKFRELAIKEEISLYEIEVSVSRYLWLKEFLNEPESESETQTDVYCEEIGRYSESLQELIQSHLEEAVQNPDWRLNLLASFCLRLGKLNIFEAVFRDTLLRPKLETFLKEAMTSSIKDVLFDFPKLLKLIKSFGKDLKEQHFSLIATIYPETESKFLIRALLEPILLWIVERCSSVFSPSNLKVFKKNFAAGISFVVELEAEYFSFEDELSSFRSQDAWISFMKRWPLHQYYHLQMSQIILPLEKCLHSPIEFNSTVPTTFAQTEMTLDVLKELWSEEVIILPLIPKFLKGSLQAIRRFTDFCNEDHASHHDPKVFVLLSLQKHYNLCLFLTKLEEEVFEAIKGRLSSFDLNLTEELFTKIRGEVTEGRERLRKNIVIGTERVYDKLLANGRLGLESCSLEAVKLLKNEATPTFEVQIQMETKAFLKNILLKFNRALFKLIDEADDGRNNSNSSNKNKNLSGLAKQIEQVEREAREMGFQSLIEEEFWLEVRTTVLNK